MILVSLVSNSVKKKMLTHKQKRMLQWTHHVCILVNLNRKCLCYNPFTNSQCSIFESCFTNRKSYFFVEQTLSFFLFSGKLLSGLIYLWNVTKKCMTYRSHLKFPKSAAHITFHITIYLSSLTQYVIQDWVCIWSPCRSWQPWCQSSV